VETRPGLARDMFGVMMMDFPGPVGAYIHAALKSILIVLTL